jgi:hypothetical protein
MVLTVLQNVLVLATGGITEPDVRSPNYNPNAAAMDRPPFGF